MLVQKTDDAYANAKGVATHLLAPGRLDSKPEPALYPPRSDPEAESRAEREARVASLLHAAAHAAKTGWLTLSGAGAAVSDKEIEVARAACVTTADYLVRAADDLHHAEDAGEAFSHAYAAVGLLFDAAVQLPTPIAEAAELQILIGKLEAPDGFRAPKTIADARKVVGGHGNREADRAGVVVHQLRQASSVTSDAIEAYRIDRDATPARKAEIFGAAAGFAADAARFAERSLSDGNLGLDATSAAHTQALTDFVQTSQRLVYWAMTGDAVKEPCDALALAVAPLSARIGLPEILVAAPRTDDQGRNLDAPGNELRGAWKRFFDTQRQAVEELANRPEPEEKPSWTQALVTGLCAAMFVEMGGLVAIALAEVVTESAAVHSIAKAAAKKLVSGLSAGLGGHVPASTEQPRRDFFMAQAYAILDKEQQVNADVVSLAIDEARRSPEGGAALAAMRAKLDAKAHDIATEMKQRAVQAWATYLLTTNWGRDEISRGADMTGLGQGIGSLQVGYPPNPNLENKSPLRPAGLLELHVSMDGGPSVDEAILHGLREDDRKLLESARVGSLTIPLQIYLHGHHDRVRMGTFETTTPSYAVISRNDAGVFWLRDSTRVGRILLAGLVDGDDRKEADVMRGAAALWEMIGNDKLPPVGS